MENLLSVLQSILHLDTTLMGLVATYGMWAYIALFAVIFCETAFIVTPILPGDSLLFAAGSLAASSDQPLNIQSLFLLLCLASILGNKLNYLIGRIIGPKVFTAKHSWLLNKKHLTKAHQFYEKHGGKTIILARFLPIIRTFAPFIAGAATMRWRLFSFYNIISAILWIGSLLAAGYYFGSLAIVKDHFSLVIYGIIAISLLPPLIAFTLRKTSP